MRRVKTLTAGILATVTQAIFSIIMLVALFLIVDLISMGATGVEGTIVLMAILTAVVLTTLVLSIVAIPAWAKDAVGFKKKKALIITAVVFNFVVVLYQLISLVTAAPAAGTIILYVILMGMSIAANVLWLIDLAQEGRKVNQPVSAAPAAQTVSSTETKLAAAEEFAQKLAKIDALRKNGVLTEEEYSEIKKSYVKDYIGK